MSREALSTEIPTAVAAPSASGPILTGVSRIPTDGLEHAPAFTSAGLNVAVPSTPGAWESLKKAYEKTGKKITLALLMTDSQHCVDEQVELMPRILKRLEAHKEYTFVVRSGSTIAGTLQSISVPDKDVSIVVIGPHAMNTDALLADIKERWGLTVPKADTDIGDGESYVVIDVSHRCCDCQQCERERAIHMKAPSAS